MVRLNMMAMVAVAVFASAPVAAQERPLPQLDPVPQTNAGPEPAARPDQHPASARTDRQPRPGTDAAARDTAPVADELGHVMTPPAQADAPAAIIDDTPEGPEPERR